MKYEFLSSAYYKDITLEHYNELYRSRFESEAAYKIPKLDVHGNPAFFMMLPQFSLMIENIFANAVKIIDILDRIPTPAAVKFSNESLIDEIIITNNIEGIYSTRKEINAILFKTSKKLRPFEGLVKKYLLLLTNQPLALHSCQDIRSLYDDIVLNEVEPDSIPDGEIFRKESVSVYSITDKEKHRGSYPEQKIINEMDSLLEFMNTSTEISYLIKIAVFHYFFGYIHPFYDGNGRTSRVITSYYINKILSCNLIGLNLAHTIKDRKNEYYHAFDDCNNPKCKGDITPFISMFLSIMEESTSKTLDKLSSYFQKLNYYQNALGLYATAANIKLNQSKCIFLLIQNELFRNEGLAIEEISQYLEKSSNTSRTIIKSISNINGIVIRAETISNKKYYHLDLSAFDEMLDRFLPTQQSNETISPASL